MVNCNLQRLDGPVRGNGSIIQELEGLFAGADWRVIKLLWGSDWDPLFARAVRSPRSVLVSLVGATPAAPAWQAFQGTRGSPSTPPPKKRCGPASSW